MVSKFKENYFLPEKPSIKSRSTEKKKASKKQSSNTRVRTHFSPTIKESQTIKESTRESLGEEITQNGLHNAFEE